MEPVIEKSLKVILSCKTSEQLAVAKRFAQKAYDSYSGIDRLNKALLPIDRALFLKHYLIKNNILVKEVT